MPPFHPAVSAAAGASSSLKLRLSLRPPRQSCLMHRNMHRDRLFRIKLSHALLSVDSSVHCVLGMWFIYTALKFWGLKWMNAENRLLEKSQQAAGPPSSARLIRCLQLTDSFTRKGCAWRRTCQPSQRHQRGILCGSSPETGIRLPSWFCFSQQGHKVHGVHCAGCPLCLKIFNR